MIIYIYLQEWTAYGDSLSGWWQLWQLLWPFGARVRLPSASEVQSRLAYISSYRLLDEARARHSDLHLVPPVAHIGLLEFQRFEEAERLGYETAQAALAEWLPRSRTFVVKEDSEVTQVFIGSRSQHTQPQQPSAAQSERKAQLLSNARRALAVGATAAPDEPAIVRASSAQRCGGSESVSLLSAVEDEDEVRQQPESPQDSGHGTAGSARSIQRARTLDKLRPLPRRSGGHGWSES
ncbi:hypothetical protein T492DRAFT_530172 [Pavlovales sp. CCMP2436]|nr:hypothetical protein T492DRAFT_530172 [Pavlovales sp. CCMP2436]